MTEDNIHLGTLEEYSGKYIFMVPGNSTGIIFLHDLTENDWDTVKTIFKSLSVDDIKKCSIGYSNKEQKA